MAIASLLKRRVEEKFGLAVGMASTREGKAMLLPRAIHPTADDIPLPDGCTVGKYLQIYGGAMRDLHGGGYWIGELMKSFDPASSRWVVTDVRFPNELATIKAAGGVVVRVACSREERMRRMGTPDGRDETHLSETALDNASFDIIIKNEGSLEELRHTIQLLVKAVL